MKNKTAKVILALVACPLVMFGISYMLPKRYTATMSLMLNPTPVAISGSDPNGAFTDIAMQNRGRSIATEIDKLTGSEVLLGAIDKTAASHPNAFADSDQAQARYDSLVNRLRVDNNKDSDSVDLRVTMDDPKLAAETANNIGQSYMDYNRKLSSNNGSGALNDIEAALKGKQAEMEKIDGQIADIKTKYNVSDSNSTGAMQDKMQKDTEAQISNIQSQLSGAQAEVASLQGQLNSTPQYMKTNEDVQINPNAVDLDQKISQAQSDLDAAKGKYTDDYPLVRQLKEKVDSLRELRTKTPDTVTGRTATSLNPNYMNLKGSLAQAQSHASSLANSLGSLQASLATMKVQGHAYPQAEKELSQLTLRKQSLSQAYATLVQQEQGLQSTNGMGREAQAQIVSIALPPGQPSFPNPKVFMLMGLAIGIILSALIVMPKAPDVMYAPTTADALALDSSAIRTNASALPQMEKEMDTATISAIEQGKPEQS